MTVCPATMSSTFLGTRNSSRPSQVQNQPENRSTSSLAGVSRYPPGKRGVWATRQGPPLPHPHGKAWLTLGCAHWPSPTSPRHPLGIVPGAPPHGSPPRQADQEGEGHGQEEVEDGQLVQLLTHRVLPALGCRGSGHRHCHQLPCPHPLTEGVQEPFLQSDMTSGSDWSWVPQPGWPRGVSRVWYGSAPGRVQLHGSSAHSFSQR